MRRRHVFAVVICLVAGLVAAVPVTAAASIVPPPVVEPTATVQGVITDAVTGLPVDGACVSAHIGDQWGTFATTCAGADGIYKFEGFPAGQARFGVTAAGYPQRWLPNSVDVGASYILVVAGPTPQQLDIALGKTAGTFAGAVTRMDGSPAPYAWIYLYRVGENYRTALFMAGIDGAFTRSHIPPGNYHMKVTWNALSQEQWFPGVTSRTSASVITIAADQSTSVSEQLIARNPPPQRIMSVITGRVTGASGSPIAGATVTVRTLGQIYTQATTDADGHYTTAQVPVGTVAVGASKAGRADIWAPASAVPRTIAFTVSTNVVDLVLPDQTGTLRGMVTDFDGSAAPFLTNVSLYSADDRLLTTIQTGLDGAFELPKLAVGSYKVQLTNSGRDSRQWLADPVTVADGQITQLNPTLYAPTYVEAQIRDESGAPVQGCAQIGNAETKCSGADGVALFGPLWRDEAVVNTSMFANGGLLHFPQTKWVDILRSQVNTVVFNLRAAAAIRLPVASYTGVVCVDLIRLGVGRTLAGPSCGYPSAGAVSFGPFEPGAVQLFVRANTGLGAHWIGADGGVPVREKATVVELSTGAAVNAPALKVEAPGAVGGTVRDEVSGAVISGICVGIRAEEPCYAITDANGHFVIGGLAPYAWPVRYGGSNGSYAVEWSGDAANRLDAVGVQVPGNGGTANAPDALLRAGGLLRVYGRANDSPLELFDARSGDPLTGTWLGYGENYLGGLNTGTVILRYNFGACWVQRPDGGRAAAYFPVRAAETTDLGFMPEPGLTCLPTEPALLAGQVRRAGPAVATPPAPRRLHFGAWVQDQLARILGQPAAPAAPQPSAVDTPDLPAPRRT